MGKRQQKVIQRLKPAPYTLNDLENDNGKQQLVPVSKLGTKDGESIDLYSTPDIPQNKRGFKYSSCRPNPLFNSIKYSTSDIKPYNVAWSLFDRSNDALINQNLNVMSVRKSHGWRSSRSNVGVREGKWYVEFRIINNNDTGHVRVGMGRREASLEAPVGFDGYAYGVRDIGCEGVHLSKRIDLGFKSDLEAGDVIGFLIELPSLGLQKDLVKMDSGMGCIRDMIPIKYKNGLFFEQFEYTSSNEMNHVLNPVTVFGEQAVPDIERFKPLELPNSKLSVFINGELLEGKWDNLLAFMPPSSEQREQQTLHNNKPTSDDGDLGYYPMASCFKGGAVELNTTTSEWIKPQCQGGYNVFGKRYQERVIEEYVWDLIDESVNSWLDKKEIMLNSK